MLKHNVTYRNRKWFWTDSEVIFIESGNSLYDWIEKTGNLFTEFKTLFWINDIIALDLVISGRHKGHSLWLLTQGYTATPKNIRRQAKIPCVWYPKNRTDLNTIHKENHIIETQEELANVKKQLKQGKHTCLIMRMEHPRGYEIC